MTRSDHIRLGTFILIGLGLMAFALTLLVMTHRQRPHVPMVTYFDESVSGLMRGSAVRFRGVEVGVVDGIRIQRGSGMIEVEFQVFTDVVGELVPGGNTLEQHPRGVQLSDGEDLRIRIQTNPITGQSSLEAQPLRPPPPALAVTIPKDRIYLPSAPSVTDTLVRSANETLAKLPGLVERFDKLVTTVDQTISAVQADQTGKDLRKFLDHLVTQITRTGDDLNRVLAEEGPIAKVMTQAGGAITSAEVGKTAADLRATFTDLRTAAGDLRLLSEDLRGNLPGIRAALDQIRATLRLIQEQPESLIHGPRKDTP